MSQCTWCRDTRAWYMCCMHRLVCPVTSLVAYHAHILHASAWHPTVCNCVHNCRQLKAQPCSAPLPALPCRPCQRWHPSRSRHGPSRRRRSTPKRMKTSSAGVRTRQKHCTASFEFANDAETPSNKVHSPLYVCMCLFWVLPSVANNNRSVTVRCNRSIALTSSWL
jgi:hypothetical protein